jgi:predicted amidohydrolase
MLNVGIVQMLAAPLRVGENLALAERCIERTVGEGAQLVVLPEMFNVGFHFGEDLMTVAEELDGRTIDWLKAQASRHGVYITGSLYERFEGYFYNTMFMVGNDGSLQYYRKRNPTCQETTVWRRSDVPGPGIFETPFGRIGGVICFDSFARETFEGFKRSAVELVVIVALWGTTRPVARHPETSLFHHLLKRWSHLASEVVPQQYATMLSVPAVFVNQAGTIRFPFTLLAPAFKTRRCVRLLGILQCAERFGRVSGPGRQEGNRLCEGRAGGGPSGGPEARNNAGGYSPSVPERELLLRTTPSSGQTVSGMVFPRICGGVRGTLCPPWKPHDLISVSLLRADLVRPHPLLITGDPLLDSYPGSSLSSV